MINKLTSWLSYQGLTDAVAVWLNPSFITQRGIFHLVFSSLLSCVLVLRWPILIYINSYNYLSVARRHAVDIFCWVVVVFKVSSGQTDLTTGGKCTCVWLLFCVQWRSWLRYARQRQNPTWAYYSQSTSRHLPFPFSFLLTAQPETRTDAYLCQVPDYLLHFVSLFTRVPLAQLWPRRYSGSSTNLIVPEPLFWNVLERDTEPQIAPEGCADDVWWGNSSGGMCVCEWVNSLEL